MKKMRVCFLCFLFTLMITHAAQSQVSLAGQWAFRLDPQDEGLSNDWFSNPLKDRTIELPGSCEQRGFGIKNTLRDGIRNYHTNLIAGLRYNQHICWIWKGYSLAVCLKIMQH
ncbi:MAG: hypothetical protein ABI472_09855 [Ginsengibacter sp.]